MLQLFQAFGGPGRIALGCRSDVLHVSGIRARHVHHVGSLRTATPTSRLNVDATIKAIEEVKPAMIVLTSPNNPTGTPLKPENLKRVLEAARTAEVAGAAEGVHPVVVVDEAYIEFRRSGHAHRAGTHRRIRKPGRQPHHEQGVRLRRRARRLPGRVNKGIIDCVRIVRMPYHLSAVTQAAALAAFEHTDEQLSRVGAPARNPRGHRRMAQGTDLQGPAARSGRNPARTSCCSAGTSTSATRIFDELLKRGVLIRVVGPEGWMRVCMGTDEEMARFREALVEVLRIVEQG